MTTKENEAINEIAMNYRRRHGGFVATAVREALTQFVKENPSDLCTVLRRTWDEADGYGPKTIAMAIDLGLGSKRAREVLAALSERNLNADKIGDDLDD